MDPHLHVVFRSTFLGNGFIVRAYWGYKTSLLGILYNRKIFC